ncbi:MAG: hypothetical protein A2W35_20815 [Chloroflexi bacterium RBG_16_57_11]|nr:MAG: hypothetical protein A2W35_20815 [Chloroflexi bacterium RBG_16_57_11]
MDENPSYQPEPIYPQLPTPTNEVEQLPEPTEMTPEQKRAVIGVVIAFIILLVLIIATTVFLLQPTTNTAKIRDVFIIFMALQSILTGMTLVILMIQLARLTNLLQNEIKPILDSTNETMNNLRGTTNFLSENLVEPVIKLNEYTAGLSTFFQALGLVRKPRK